MKKKTMKTIFILITIIFSIVVGIISQDIIIGIPLLITGFFCAFFGSEGKRINFIFAFFNYILMAYCALKNNLYGTFFLYSLYCIPMQVIGFLMWKNNLDENNEVKKRKFTFKTSLIVTFLCITCSFILGLLLSFIPSQNLSFLDASSNIINICGIILFNQRYKECWIIWLVNNLIDETIWLIRLIDGGSNAIMMFLVSTAYLLINLYALTKWNKEAKETN